MLLAKPCHTHFSLNAVARVTSLALAFFTADFLAPFFALLLESPAVCYAIRYGKARPLFTRVTALAHERPGRPVIGDVLFPGPALTQQALDNSLSETGIAIRFSESVYLFRSPGTCYSGPSESVKQSVHRFR